MTKNTLSEIELLKARIEELTERKVNASRQIKKLSDQNSELENEFTACHGSVQRSETLFEEKNHALAEMTEQVNEINKQCAAINADLEDEKSGIIDIVRRTAQLHNEIQSMSTYRTNLTGQKD